MAKKEQSKAKSEKERENGVHILCARRILSVACSVLRYLGATLSGSSIQVYLLQYLLR